MKRLFSHLIIIIWMCFFVNFHSYGQDINKDFYKFKKILIPLSKDGSWKLIGKKSEGIYSATITWKYLAQTKDGQLSRLIELVHSSIARESVSQSRNWFQDFAYQKNGFSSCIRKNSVGESAALREKYYVYEESEKLGSGCFFTRNIDIEKEILYPSIGRKTLYVDTNHFSRIIRKYINNETKFPKIMLRSDHYFISQKELYGYFELINPDVNGAPNTLFKSERQSEYHALNIDNHPQKKHFYLSWIKGQAQKHSQFETELKRTNKIDLAKYINYDLIKDLKDNSEVTQTAKKDSEKNNKKKTKTTKLEPTLKFKKKEIIKVAEGTTDILNVNANSKGITYKVMVAGKMDGDCNRTYEYFTGLSKISITDALVKATKPCKNFSGRGLACKVFSGKVILKDGTKIKLTKTEIKSGVQKTQIAKAEPTLKVKKKKIIKVAEGSTDILNVNANSKGITYKVMVAGAGADSNGKYEYFTGLSKISITDALAKATKPCKNRGRGIICKVFSGKVILKDGTKIKLTKTEIKSGVQKTQIAKAEPTLKVKKKKIIKVAEGSTDILNVNANSKGITYKVMVAGAGADSNGKYEYFTGLSKISITDALAKATKPCKNRGRGIICKVYSGKEILKDGTKIKLTKTEIKSGVQKTQIAKAEPTLKLKKKKRIKVVKVEENTQEEFKPKKTNQDNEAPVIKIAEAITVNDANYEIEGSVTDKSDKIFVQINGRNVTVTNGKFKMKRFSPVDEEIQIIATDQWGNASKPKLVSVIIDQKDNDVATALETLNPSKILSKSNKNKVALIIGIEKYDQTPEASYANLDAKYFYEYAKKGFGISKSNIKLLVDEDANLIKSLGTLNKWLPSKIKSGETELIIFFAGHGLASNDGKELYLLPQDSDPDLLARTALSRTELFKQIISLNPKNVTIFLDTCYSGVSRDEKTLLASARPVRIVADEQETPNNFTIFSASQLDQISSGLKEAKHGIFSYYLNERS